MCALLATIDTSNNLIEFSGSGTFSAKEKIKGLGAARWDPVKRLWRVSDCALSADEIRSIFPDIEIAQSGSNEQRSQQGKELLESEEDKPAEGFSVSQLIGKISAVLNGAFRETVLVHGVISSLNRKGQRVYLEMSDPEETSQRLACVIWQNEQEICRGLHQAGFRLEQELQVMFAVQVRLRPGDARISLTVVDVIAEYTLGKLSAQRELTNKRLKEERIFDRNRQTQLPLLPVRLGVITSEGGTVINDLLASLSEARFGFQVAWFQTSVQGSLAAKGLVRGLQHLVNNERLDAILIFRGGGSAADLAVFNDYELAKAICLSPVPVLSAIGHQEDQSSVQDVSFQALGVPKDVGRFFADIVLELRRALHNMSEQLVYRGETLSTERSNTLQLVLANIQAAGLRILQQSSERLESIVKQVPQLSKREVSRKLEQLREHAYQQQAFGMHLIRWYQSQVENISEQLGRLGESSAALFRVQVSRLGDKILSSLNLIVERFGTQLEGHDRILQEIAPETQLRRGYCFLRRESGDDIITSGEDLKKGDRVDITFYDRVKRAMIQE